MATRKQCLKRAAELGVELVEDEPYSGGYGLFQLETPKGKRFASSGLHMVPFHIDPTWKMSEVYDFYMKEMKYGLENCTDPDCDYCTDPGCGWCGDPECNLCCEKIEAKNG